MKKYAVFENLSIWRCEIGAGIRGDFPPVETGRNGGSGFDPNRLKIHFHQKRLL